MEDRLSKVPLSFEATVKLPEALDGRGGVIIGSWMDAGYYDYDLGYVSLEVYENGRAPPLLASGAEEPAQRRRAERGVLRGRPAAGRVGFTWR